MDDDDDDEWWWWWWWWMGMGIGIEAWSRRNARGYDQATGKQQAITDRPMEA
jgi:hypothetical protein